MIIVMVLFVVPLGISAATFEISENSYVIDSRNLLKDDLYVVARSITISAAIEGDALLVGNDISIKSDVSGDVAILGGSTFINNVSDDVRIIAGEVVMDGSVGDDVMLMGGDIYLTPNTEIGGSVYIKGGSVTLNGNIAGDVKIEARNVKINSTIGGNLNINTPNSIEVGEKANILGSATYRAPEEVITKEIVQGDLSYDKYLSNSQADRSNYIASISVFLVKVATWSVVTALAVFIFGKQLKLLTERTLRKSGINLLAGVGFILITPPVILILILTFVGIPLALIFMSLFAILLLFSKIASFVIVGSVVSKWLLKSEDYKINWEIAVLGVFTVMLLSAIPIVGWIFKVLLCLLVLGALFLTCITSKK